jgi:hypothetical protein
MLKIVKQSEPLRVERINLCLYGPPGLGKTTLAFTADKPLLLDCDGGCYRAPNRKDSVPVNSWADIANITAADLAPYNTIIVDTAGRALDFLTQDIIAGNPKMGRGGALTLQGFGELKAKFTAWLKSLRLMGKEVLLVAHMDEQRSGDDVIERLDVQGGSKGEIYKSVDAMGRVIMRNGQRYLDFSPRENSFGKNPCNLDVLPIPEVAKEPDFLAEVVERIKSRLNQRTAEQEKASDELADWTLAIEAYSAVEEFNKNLPAIKKTAPAVQLLASKRAKSLGFVYDPKKMQFVEKKQPAAQVA